VRVGKVKTVIREGGSMGDLYVTALTTDAKGFIYVDYQTNEVMVDKNAGPYGDGYIYAGNSQPLYNMGWRNSFSWKRLTLGFLINARVGGKVVSLTQGLMDAYGVSKRTANDRDAGGVMINGARIPAVQKFNWGGQQGIMYANANLGTNIEMHPEDFIYQGTFSDIAAGQQIAASMFDRGVTCIHAAAGGVGVGVINEAKARRQVGKDVWVVGVDVNQYNEGLLPDKKSVVLTSAMKYVDRASYDMVKDELDGKFQGGRTLILTAKEDAVGIPPENPNLSDEVQAKVNEIYQQIKSGAIVVADKQGDLFR